MFDRFVEFMTIFDWISPVMAWVQDIFNGPSYTFLVPEDSGWSGREIQGMLKRHGVRVWGLMIVNRTLMLSVRQAQARWAQYLLQRYGVPVENPLVGSHRNPQRVTSANATSSVKPGSPTHWMDDLARKIGF
jgi:hypothetical protein